MIVYSNTVTDQNGSALPGIEVRVLGRTIYDVTTGTEIIQPFFTGPTGLVSFQAPDGNYVIQYRRYGIVVRQDDITLGASIPGLSPAVIASALGYLPSSPEQAPPTATYDKAPSVIQPASTPVFASNGKSVALGHPDATYRAVTSEPSHTGKIQISGQWYELIVPYAVPDFFSRTGDADDSIAVQRALDYCASRGIARLQFLSRLYEVSAQTMTLNSAVQIHGMGGTESGLVTGESPTNISFTEPLRGTILRANCVGHPAFNASNGNVRGARFDDLMFIQTHAQPPVSGAWTPTNYDYLIRNYDCFGGITIGRVTARNINRVLDCRNSGRLHIERLWGQWFTTGVQVDRAYDVCYIDNMHQWTFWSGNKSVVAYMNANQTNLKVGRVDGLHVESIFNFGGGKTVHYTDVSGAGTTIDARISRCYSDVSAGIVIDVPGVNVSFGELTVQCEDAASGNGSALASSNGLIITGDAGGGMVKIGNLRAERFGNAGIINQSNTTVSITGQHRYAFYPGATPLISQVANNPIRLYEQEVRDASGLAINEAHVARALFNK